jgi:hypothetical protein
VEDAAHSQGDSNNLSDGTPMSDPDNSDSGPKPVRAATKFPRSVRSHRRFPCSFTVCCSSYVSPGPRTTWSRVSSDVHDVFHVYQLKKCLRVPKEHILMEQLDLGGDLVYNEWPIKILDTTKRVTRSMVTKMCKVQWSHHTEDEANWEHEEELRADYPYIFP